MEERIKNIYDSFNRNKLKSNSYKLMIYITIGFFLLMFLGNTFLGSKEQNANDIDKNINLETQNITLNAIDFYKDKGIIEVNLNSEKSTTILKKDIEVYISLDKNPFKKVKLDAVINEDNVKVYRLYNFKQRFKTVFIWVKEKEDTKDKDEDESNKEVSSGSKRFAVSLNYIGDKTNKKLPKKQVYLALDTKKQIEKKEEKIKEIRRTITKNNSDIKKLKAEINNLESDKKYQTATEITDTDSQISTILSNIDSMKDSNIKLEDEVKNTRDQIEKLKEKVKDLNKNTK